MLKLIRSGFYTTLQDAGRFGYRDKGVPVSGPMDAFSAVLANKTLGNSEDAAVLEITMTGPGIFFDQDTYIAVTGAVFEMWLNGVAIENNRVYKVVRGSMLSFGRLHHGFRAYLGIKNGFQTEKVLGSRSFYIPITAKNHYREGDVIPYIECAEPIAPLESSNLWPEWITDSVLEVYKGPEYLILSDKDLEKLFSRNFSVAKENNRMAYQINETIGGHTVSMLTSATLPGTVQLTPSGKLIVLMKDGQTTGGYPRILQLSDKAICVLAQKRAMEHFTFKLIG